MVSKRQKEARKRFKEEHPELFPKQEATAPQNPNKKKKHGTSKAKRMKPVSKDPNKRKRSSSSKHPLRIPGMKPGESCYICKEKDHIAKDCPEKSQWEKNKICLLCRHRGHSLKNCPNKSEETLEKSLCYNCGKTDHSLAKCPRPLQDGGTKFASCFICKGQGHLSKNCPQNTHGIYPKGGSCKICGGVTHLAKDCPNKGIRGSITTEEVGYASLEIEGRSRGKVTKLTSGDDLDDDFSTHDTQTSNKDEPSVVGSVFDSKANNVKQKKKHGPKVVNFVG